MCVERKRKKKEKKRMELYGIKEKRYIYKSEDDGAWHFLDIFSKHSKLCYVGLKKLTHNRVNDFLSSDFDEMFDKESEREQALAIISFIERRNICDQFHIEYCEFYYELLPNVFATRTEAEVYVAKNCNDALVVHLQPEGCLKNM